MMHGVTMKFNRFRDYAGKANEMIYGVLKRRDRKICQRYETS